MTAGRHPVRVLDGLDGIIEVVGDLARSFTEAGHRLYLVGGVVRDLALGAASTGDDIDLTTDASPARSKALIRPHASALWTQGERFGTIGATVGGRDIEVTTHRAEAYSGDSRNPVVAFGTSIDDDLVRRDFTINAMAVSLPDRQLLDPFGGIDDLEAGRLRTPGPAVDSFGDDPLRMLRAARFLPRFGLEPDAELLAAAVDLADRLPIVSVERIHDELERLLAVAEPALGFEFLGSTGLLQRAIPRFADVPGASDDACGLAGAPGSVLVRRAGLFAPLGPAAPAALARLRYSNTDTKATLALIHHLDAALEPEPTAGSVRRVVATLGRAATDELLALARNRAGLRAWRDGRLVAVGEPPDPFAAVLAGLSGVEDLDDLDPPLSGREVMDHLGLGEGPEVGAVMSALRERRLDHGPFDRGEALDWLDRWAAGRARTGADGS